MRIAVAGMGFMGVTHARAWFNVPDVELAVVSRSDKKRDVKGNIAGAGGDLDLSAARTYRSLDEALADPAVDALDLCLPTDLHADVAARALRAGKHCLVEKPLALHVGDAESLAAEAERSGRVLMCGQVLRFAPAYTMARELIAKLGPVRSAFFGRRCAVPEWSQWLGDPKRSGGGVFDLLIHDVDFVRWVFGMPDEVWSSGDLNLRTALLTYEGFQTTVTGGWYPVKDYPFSMGFSVLCHSGVVEYEGGILRAAGEVIILPATDMFEAELREFAACVRNGTPSAICPVEQSVDAVRLMRRILDEE